MGYSTCCHPIQTRDGLDDINIVKHYCEDLYLHVSYNCKIDYLVLQVSLGICKHSRQFSLVRCSHRYDVLMESQPLAVAFSI